MTLHAIALREAEYFNPYGQHAVTSIEIDGDPQDGPGDARITVATRVPCDAQRVAINITSVSV